MSRSDSSPFTPGQPVSPDLFTGRDAELDRLRGFAADAASGRLQVAFLSGERGIGKSSIARLVRLVGERNHDLLAVHAYMGGAKTVEEAVRRIFDQVAKIGQGENWFAPISKLFGKHLKTLDLFGIQLGFQPDEAALKQLVEHFDTALRTVLTTLQGKKHGFFLILDDINGLASSEPFAHWLKSFVDSIATSDQPLPLFLLVVGLEERRRQLIALQPSLARLFHLVDIGPWSQDETEAFYRKAFEPLDIVIDASALRVMSTYAGGLPVLAHEIGDAAYRLDKDDHISERDAWSAVVWAADVVGRKHVDPQVFQAIRSKKYRQILQKIPENLGFEFKRADVLGHLDPEEAGVLDNFLQKMKKLGVLEPSDEGQGWYRFTSKLHFLYFWSVSEAARSDLADR
jgi:hypothetical protein